MYMQEVADKQLSITYKGLWMNLGMNNSAVIHK